jgi:hypothetical protein
MIMSFMSANELHGVHSIAQKGMTKIGTRGLCGVEGDAGQGIFQVPDWAFDGRQKFGETPICGKCATSASSKPPVK